MNSSLIDNIFFNMSFCDELKINELNTRFCDLNLAHMIEYVCVCLLVVIVVYT